MESNIYESYIFQMNAKIKEISEFINKNANILEAHEMEKQILLKIFEIGKESMKEYFQKIENNDVGLSIKDAENNEYKRYNIVSRNYFSIFGKIEVNRVSYRKKGMSAIYPLDIQCNMPEKTYSYFLQEIMNSMSINSPFLECEEDIFSLFNLKIHDKQFEEITHDTTANYQEYYEQNEVPLPESEGELQVLSFDGKGVPMIKSEAAKIIGRLGKGEKKQKKKESLVGISYTVNRKERTAQEVAQNLIFPQSTTEKEIKTEIKKKKSPEEKKEAKELSQKYKAKNIRRIASLKQEKTLTIKQIEIDAQKRNKDNKRSYIVLIDGSLYLWKNIVKVLTIPNYVIILDIIHVLEYLYLAAHTIHKENTHDAKCFVYKMLKTILEGKVDLVIKELGELSKPKEINESKKNALNKTINYLTNHKDLMCYDQYLANGYPIGTGVVESACKLLVKDRMEGSGMRWSLNGAESMLLLRSIKYSSDSNDYYKFNIEKQRIRLYDKKQYTVNELIKQVA